MQIGDRVFITDWAHPYFGLAGDVVAVNEQYGLGWKGHRVKLDGNQGESYVNDDQVHTGKPRIDSIKYTYSKPARRKPANR